MKHYIKICVQTEVHRVNHLLEEGWEMIEAKKFLFPSGGEGVEYHLGLPAETRIKQLVEIIRTYEKFGYKSSMMHDFAESKKEDILSYTTEQELYMPETPVTKFITLYEEAVHGKTVKYYKRRKHPFDDPELDYIDIDMYEE
ncbi:hypothetical protein [Cytobacillus firmus]|uniref:hypothetical protein n=1 Tax=Cytobacillus firmus TaxID=1399 RepID=UPI00064F4BF8|nr:hypothetical protein [Cytobacillus firmus]KML40621.1 hypothetical protein VL14_13250 [Cytobacillus firmus]